MSELSEMPVEMFMQKLGDIEAVKATEASKEDVVKNLAQKFVAFGQDMSVFFERRARLFSVLISLIVAWVFYVHPYNLAVAYLKNPELAQDVADLSDKLLEKVKTQEGQADSRKDEKVAKPEAPTDAVAPAQEEDPPETAQADGNSVKDQDQQPGDGSTEAADQLRTEFHEDVQKLR